MDEKPKKFPRDKKKLKDDKAYAEAAYDRALYALGGYKDDHAFYIPRDLPEHMHRILADMFLVCFGHVILIDYILDDWDRINSNKTRKNQNDKKKEKRGIKNG